MSFTNTRVIIKPAYFPFSNNLITASQDFDGPTYLYVGSLASNEACKAISERFKVNVNDLLEIREGGNYAEES
jgi:hypothetical protein